MTVLFSFTLHASFKGRPDIPLNIYRLQIAQPYHIKCPILKCQEWMTYAVENI